MIKSSLLNISNNFIKLADSCENEISEASTIIINAIKDKKKIMFCGNGGSAADSQHLAAELVGRYKKDREPFAAIALSTDTSTITAISNDYNFENIFSRQVEAIGNSGDVLYAISTSGNSRNVINAINHAIEKKIKVIGVTGENGGNITNLCDCIIKVPSARTDRVQEMHIAVGHIICEIVENTLC